MKKLFTIILIFTVFTIADYANFRNDLIKSNGIEAYHEMNEDAGIKNELQSYLYYTIYRR